MRLSPAFSAALFYVLLLLGEDPVAGWRRGKRVIAFPKGSTYFYRLNFKINIFPYTTIMSFASGFKVAWELPTGSPYREGRSARDIHEGAESVYESQGLDGRSCLLKNICEASEYASRTDGAVAKIVKLLVGPMLRNDTSTGRTIECEDYVAACPLQFAGVSGLSTL